MSLGTRVGKNHPTGEANKCVQTYHYVDNLICMPSCTSTPFEDMANTNDAPQPSHLLHLVLEIGYRAETGAACLPINLGYQNQAGLAVHAFMLMFKNECGSTVMGANLLYAGLYRRDQL